LNILSTQDTDEQILTDDTVQERLPTSPVFTHSTSILPTDNSYVPPARGSKLEKFQKWSESDEIVGKDPNKRPLKPVISIEKPKVSIEKIEFDEVSNTYNDLHSYISGGDETIPDSLIHTIQTYFEKVEKNIPYDIDLLFKAYIFLICQDCINFRNVFNEKLPLKNKDEYFRFVKFWVLSTLISQL
jgi:hypothetical protein